MHVWSHLTLCELVTIACQTPLSMEFPKQIYLSWFPCPTPGDLTDPGIEPMPPASPAWAGRFFTSVPLGKPSIIMMCHLMFYQRTVLNTSWKNSKLFESVWILISAFFEIGVHFGKILYK